MKTLMERLKSNEVLVCDGAMGTNLQLAGLEPGQAPEDANISKPQIVRSIHKGFIDAGCDMIVTNTFGSNPIKLNRAGLSSGFTEINAVAVALAKEISNSRAYVLGDIGPTGEFLKPIGTYDYQQFYDAFLKQAVILHKGGVDAFIIETMSSSEETKAAISACKAAGELPVIASMTFMLGEKGYHTMMGVSIEDAVKTMLGAGADVIGANCGCGSQQMVEIMNQMNTAVKKITREKVFLIAQPNAGMPKLINGNTVFTETASDFKKIIPDLIKLGVNIIGGCCGTTPEHIKEIVKIAKGR